MDDELARYGVSSYEDAAALIQRIVGDKALVDIDDTDEGPCLVMVAPEAATLRTVYDVHNPAYDVTEAAKLVILAGFSVWMPDGTAYVVVNADPPRQDARC